MVVYPFVNNIYKEGNDSEYFLSNNDYCEAINYVERHSIAHIAKTKILTIVSLMLKFDRF